MSVEQQPLKYPTRPAQFAAIDLIDDLINQWDQPGWLLNARDFIAERFEKYAAGANKAKDDG